MATNPLAPLDPAQLRRMLAQLDIVRAGIEQARELLETVAETHPAPDIAQAATAAAEEATEGIAFLDRVRAVLAMPGAVGGAPLDPAEIEAARAIYRAPAAESGR